jgi:protein-S-isoprenylcysteine O-methyltransferase Ste14
MNTPSWIVIQVCWTAWLVYWVLMSFGTKRTVERGNWASYRLVAILIVLAALALDHAVNGSEHARLWHTGTALGVVTALLVIAGLAFTVWARIVLGRNWSAEITFKQDHELIESGPYALSRHPIYTGLLAMGIGTAVNYGHAIGFVILAGVGAAIWWKAREEERLMSRHFPDEYPRYRARVHAIIPFVL